MSQKFPETASYKTSRSPKYVLSLYLSEFCFLMVFSIVSAILRLILFKTFCTKYLRIWRTLTDSETTEKDVIESLYPPANIDWSIWEPAGVADARSPCPMLNALCNHHILPHNGRKITREMAVTALVRSINLDPNVAAIFTDQGISTNPNQPARSFDLNHLAKHGAIEHDVSLSRNDAKFGDNRHFNREIWADVIKAYGDDRETSFETASKARYERVRASKKAHEDVGLRCRYGIKELVLSYGETALLLSLLGDPEEGRISVGHLRVLIEQARLPYREGWRKSPRPITQKDMNHLIVNLIKANDQKQEEALIVSIGTMSTVISMMQSLLLKLRSVV